jgi:hypothetical protein
VSKMGALSTSVEKTGLEYGKHGQGTGKTGQAAGNAGRS